MTAPTEHAESRSDPRAVRVAALLPAWLGSIRFRLAALYSLVVWGIAALLVGGIYLFLARELQRQAVTDARLEFVAGQQCMRMPDGRASCFPVVDIDRESFASFLAAVEGNANARALEQFRRYSYTALAFLFVVSMTVGWVLADRALRPIGRITRVARRISATDLSQRIDLQRPPDELKELADTFDDMLGRIETAFEGQRSFIHEASHELRNPIAVIRTNVDVALADPDAPPEELRDTLGVVGKAAARMGVLVDDLLTYARREAPAERTTVLDLAEVVSETAAEFSVPAASRGLELSCDASPGLRVCGDAVALKRALGNLAANAIRLAPPNTEVSLRAGRDGAWVWMACADQGPGMDSQQQERAFDRFWRGDPAGARDEGRSGLGLTIVRQIAQGHGGTVGLVSAPGVGSTFSVWLPAYTGDDEGPPESSPGAQLATTGGDRATLDR